jgi:hypothetical protein
LQKLTVIVVFNVVLVCYGCAVNKLTERNRNNKELNNPTYGLLERVEANNLTNNNLFIEKGKISIIKPDGEQNAFFSMKFVKPDKYLISVRSIVGMEFARILLTKDTILVNDRINKKILFGKAFEFERIAGIPLELIKIGVGDIVTEEQKVKVNNTCIEGRMSYESLFKGQKIEFIIDCKKGKVLKAVINNGLIKKDIEINFKNYRRAGNLQIPEKIEISDLNRNIKVFIRIEKVKAPWQGEIEFIPGKGYEKQKLI